MRRWTILLSGLTLKKGKSLSLSTQNVVLRNEREHFALTSNIHGSTQVLKGNIVDRGLE